MLVTTTNDLPGRRVMEVKGMVRGVIATRYDADEIMEGVTEVLACGAAAWAEPSR